MTDHIQELTISTLGHRGDGIAETGAGSVFVAGGLPGEIVRAELKGNRAAIAEIVRKSPERTEQACGHFSLCGGCQVQHLSEPAYLAWKQQLVRAAFATQGLEVPVAAVVPCKPGTRRRAALTAVKAGRRVLMGYHEKATHKLVDIQECPVLVPPIVEALPGLRKLCALVMPKKGDVRVSVLSTSSGLDVALDKATPKYTAKIPDLSQLAMEMDLARLTINGEILLEARPPALIMNGMPVVPPPGGFAQATAPAEAALAELVSNAVGEARKVADLFAGIGTFALRLAEAASVHAVESDAAALKSLDTVLRRRQGLKQITMERRDLFRRPLMAEELTGFDAVVFDPPRAGAQEQAKQLAQSKVPLLVAVSCNPATLVRDAKLLMDGGYDIETVVPVDQFLWSPHIECVAIMKRK